MHLLGTASIGIVKCENGALRPAMTFRQQRHRPKDRCGCGSKSSTDFAVSVGTKAPFQSRANVVESDKVGSLFRSGYQGWPFDSTLLQPLLVINCMTRSHVSELGVGVAAFSGVRARRVQQLIAHHCRDRASRHHRLGDEALNGAKDE